MLKMKQQTTQAMHSYLMMKTSLEKFAKIASELTTTEQATLENIVKVTLTLYDAVLASDEAKKIPEPIDNVEEALQQLASRFPKTTDFAAVLHANNLDQASLRVALKNEIHCEQILAQVSNDCDVIDDQQVQAYYFQHLEKFKQPERRRARHILITINDEFSENTAVNARQRLADIAPLLNVDNFSWYAQRYSECPTAMNEGQLGLVEQGKLHKELDQQLFTMSASSVSDITETEAGLHLLLCEEIQPAHTVSYHQAKEKIIEQHLKAARIRKQKSWIASRVKQTHTA